MNEQTQTLARLSPAQLEQFLVELANLQLDLDSIRRFHTRFASFIPPQDPVWTIVPSKMRDVVEKMRSELPSDVSREEIKVRVWIIGLWMMIQNIWIEPDPRQKEWWVFGIRVTLYKAEDATLTIERLFGLVDDYRYAFRVPPPTPFEQALVYLVKVGDKARYCANPECPAPYFFVKRKNQRYCSEICAAPAQRELKRQWWAEHGEEWRAERQSKKPSKRKTGKGKTSKATKKTTKETGKRRS